MNVEIKYRAWDKQKKQMVYGIEETYDGLPYSKLNEKVELDIYNHMSCFSSWLCGDYEVMQYAVLKDKNSVEIYEGDIFKDRDGNAHVVKFAKGEFGCDKVVTIDYRTRKKYTSHEPLVNYVLDGCEVVGNVYTNPELLEVSK